MAMALPDGGDDAEYHMVDVLKTVTVFNGLEIRNSTTWENQADMTEKSLNALHSALLRPKINNQRVAKEASLPSTVKPGTESKTAAVRSSVDDFTEEECNEVFGLNGPAKHFNKFVRYNDPEKGRIVKHRIIDWASLTPEEIDAYDKNNKANFIMVNRNMNMERYAWREKNGPPVVLRSGTKATPANLVGRY